MTPVRKSTGKDSKAKSPRPRIEKDKPLKDKEFKKKDIGGDSEKPYKKRESSSDSEKTTERPFKKKTYGDYKKEGEIKSRYSDKKDGESSDRTYKKRTFSEDKSSDRPFKRKTFGDDKKDGDRKPWSSDKKEGDSTDRPYKKRTFGEEKGTDRPYKKKTFGDDKKDGERRPWSSDKKDGDSTDRPYKKRTFGEDKGTDRPYKKKTYGDDKKDGERKPWSSDKKDGNSTDHPYKKRTFGEDKGSDRPYKKKTYGDDKKDGERKPWSSDKKEGGSVDRPYKKRTFGTDNDDKSAYEKYTPKKFGERSSSKTKIDKRDDDQDGIRLNKYISNAGICSRREADVLIENGAVTVNGKIVTELGTKVSRTDVIKYGGETLKSEKNVYLVLNKPKDYITTLDDPQNRKTVLALIGDACKERIYPVGRLDRDTTGLLLFTNDGELTKKLTHPKYGVKKIYHIILDRPLAKADFEKIYNGITLEDGPIEVDEIAYIAADANKRELGVELHSGRNRIVRRIFEHLEYNIVKLDRVYFAGITKKDLPRGRWRFLSQMEINMLKMIG
jgi:23S rRNA pseudouridine2605 synthase